MKEGQILDVLDHPNKEKYPKQKIYVIEFNNYILEVPFVRNDNEIFLKTAYPSRKMTQKYLKEKNPKQKISKGENIK